MTWPRGRTIFRLGVWLVLALAGAMAATSSARAHAVLIEADEHTGKALDIERLSYSLDELQQMPLA